MSNSRRLLWFIRLKRAVDVVLLCATLPVTVPVVIIVAASVAITTGRPVLYRQERLGLNEETFTLFKFRTMDFKRDADGILLPDGERMTHAGRALRKLSLDELPQIYNIARGDMSIIGPRPLFTWYLPYYTSVERRRHLVRPGMTGLAQVTGRNSVLWKERLALDTEYVEQASLKLDAIIFFRTIKQVFSAKDVSVVAGDSGAPLDVDRALPESSSIRLVPFCEEDIPTRVAWGSHSNTHQYMQLPRTMTLESTKAWFFRSRKDPSRVDITAWERANDRRVAMAGLKEVLPGVAELYIFVDPDLSGRGYGYEVSKLVVDWALNVRAYERVHLTVDLRNRAALTIYSRLGFDIVEQNGDRVWMELSADA